MIATYKNSCHMWLMLKKAAIIYMQQDTFVHNPRLEFILRNRAVFPGTKIAVNISFQNFTNDLDFNSIEFHYIIFDGVCPTAFFL